MFEFVRLRARLAVLAGTVAGLMATGAGAPAHAQVPAVEDFFAETSTTALRLSPSGESLAFVNRSSVPHTVTVVDLESFEVSKAMRLGVDRLKDVQWATDDRLLVKAIVPVDLRIRGFRGEIEDFPILQLLAIDRDGEDPVVLMGGREYAENLDRADVASLLPGQPDHIMMTAGRRNRLRLVRVNIRTGEAEEIEKGTTQTTGWKLDRNGVPTVRYDASSRGRWFKIRTRAPGSEKWETFAKVKTEDVEAISPIAQADAPNRWYVAARRPGDDRSAIWIYDLAARSFVEKVYEHPRVDVRAGETNNAGEFIGVSFDDGRRTYDFDDPQLDAHLKALKSFFGADTDIVFEGVSRDGQHWLLHVEGPQEVGSHFVYDVARTHAEPIDTINPKLRRAQLGRTETVSYTARDGQEITGYLTHPASSTGTLGSAPLVVRPHGGPHLRDRYGFDRNVQFLASRGYAVFQPNFRGSTGFGDAFEEAGHGEWGGAMQDDITDGVEHLIETGRASRDKVAIVGASYGGYAALMGLVRDPDLYQCGVSINGISDLEAMLEYDEGYFGRRSEAFEAMTATLGDRKKDKDRLRLRSPVHQVGVITKPVLLIAGERDRRVEASQSRAMADALGMAGKPHKLVLYEGANHSLRGRTQAMKDSKTNIDDDYAYAQKAHLREIESFLATCFE